MAVNQPNPGLYMQALGNHVTTFRDALQVLINDAKYLNANGGIAALEAAPFNMASTDATEIMATVGTITPTNAVVQQVQSFIDSTEFLWGGN